MKVEELMTTGAVTVKEGATIAEAREQMESLDIHVLPVVDANGYLVGIVSPQDLVTGHEQTLPISRVMTNPAQTLPRDAPISAAARIMREHQHHHVVIMDGHSIVGVLSSLDLLVQMV